MNPFYRIDRVTLLEDAVRCWMAERERKASEQEALRVRYLHKLWQQFAVRTPLLRAAVERAEEPYQALLISAEWGRMLAALSIGETTPITALVAPVEASLRGWSLSFGPIVILSRKVHYMAPETTILQVAGTLTPLISWWEVGRSIPQEPGSPLVSLRDRMTAYRTVLNLCLLLRRGRLLRAIQSGYLRRIGDSPPRLIHRRTMRHTV